MRFPGWILLAAFVVVDPAGASDMLGIYAGAGAGRAQVRADPGPEGIGAGLGFGEQDTGWTASLGIRPIPFFGAEVQYFDFGHPSRTTSGYRIDAQARGPALFALGYLPLPISRLELYAKAGVGSLHVTASRRTLLPVFCPATFIFPNCADAHAGVTNARFGWGAGARLKVSSSLAAQVEYARLSAPTGDPELLSLSLIWAF